MTAQRVFTVTAERGAGKWCVLECAELGAVSQVRKLADASDEMREALSYLSGMPEDAFAIEVRALMPDDLAQLMAQAAQLRVDAAIAQRQASDALRAAAKALHDRGLTHRDVAAVMGLSHQRVSQLVA